MSTDATAKSMSTGEDQQNRKVFIAIDRSEHSEKALRWYAKCIRNENDSVIFGNVTEPPELPLGFGLAGAAMGELYGRAMEEAMSQAKKLAADVKHICTSLGITKIRFLERIAHDAGPSICDMANEVDADMIIMGSRGMGSLRRTFLGSVSDYVLHHSHRPITVVPNDKTKACDRHKSSTEDKASQPAEKETADACNDTKAA